MNDKNYKIEERWTPELIKHGFTPVSDFFIDHYSSLTPPIRPSEALFIIHLLRYKWSAEAPFPSFGSLANKIGLSVPSTRALARELEKKGYLSREIRKLGSTNKFHLQPLFTKLEEAQRNIYSRKQLSSEKKEG